MSTEDEKKVFRKWFRHVGELRSLFPSAVLMALSATCTLTLKKKVLSSLNLENAVTISISPNRPNIKYSVCRTDKSLNSALFWLVDALNEEQETFPRCIVFCNSIKDVGDIFDFLTGEVVDHSIIEMFHSETTDEKKKAILSALSIESKLRVVIATSALGMGVDILGCSNVILYGPPKTIIDFVQQTGRCGRDGSSCLALILCNQYQLGSVDQEVKDIIKTKECRRQSILNHFLSSSELKALKSDIKHTCCDLCTEICDCGHCIDLPLEKMLQLEKVVSSDSEVDSSSDTISYTFEDEIVSLELSDLELDQE